jgi:hypothetical protein
MSGQWTRSEFEGEGEILYFFKGKNGREAYLAMHSNGTIEFKGTKEIVIKNIGSVKEKAVVKNASDLWI